MTEEEKEAIELIKSEIERCKDYRVDLTSTLVPINMLEILLNLIEKQDKMIDLIVEDYIKYTIPTIGTTSNPELKNYFMKRHNDGRLEGNILSWIKDFFRKKVENE